MPVRPSIIAAAVLALLAPASSLVQAAAEPDAARLAAARTLVTTIGIEQQARAQQDKIAADAEATFNRLVPAQVAFRAQLADAQGFATAKAQTIKLLTEDRQQVLAEALPLVVDAEARRYAAHFSVDELRALNTFYRSPLGQRLIAEQPGIAADNARFQQTVLAPMAVAHSTTLTPKLAVLIGPILTKGGVTVPSAPPVRPGNAPAKAP